MKNEQRLREQSASYLPCFNDHCERHETCLHWLVGQHTTQDAISIPCVNPMRPEVKAGRCPMYRENQVVSYARGMIHFFDEMPGRLERAIKGRLIALYSRKKFYEFRNGTRPISPDVQSVIARICQECGWTATPQYDAWEENYRW